MFKLPALLPVALSAFMLSGCNDGADRKPVLTATITERVCAETYCSYRLSNGVILRYNHYPLIIGEEVFLHDNGKWRYAFGGELRYYR